MTQPTQPVAQPVASAPPPRPITIPALDIPVTTIIHLIVVIVGAVLLIVNGNLSQDYLIWSSAVEGGNGLVTIGRGIDARARP